MVSRSSDSVSDVPCDRSLNQAFIDLDFSIDSICNGIPMESSIAAPSVRQSDVGSEFLMDIDQHLVDCSLVLDDPVDASTLRPRQIQEELVLADPLIPIPLPPPEDDHLTLATLVWGRNVPVLEKRDPRLCAQIVNLSGRLLSTDQIELLSLGLHFRLSPRFFPRLKLIAGVESAARDFSRSDPEQSAWFKSEAARLIHHAKPIKSNLSENLRQAAKKLSQQTELTITSADKGGRTVVLLSDHYAELCFCHLEDKAYKRVESFGSGRATTSMTDPTTGLDCELLNESFIKSDLSDKLLNLQCSRLSDLLKSLVASKDLDPQALHNLSPLHPYSGTIPKFYGLPKIHKIGPLQIRPIIANSGLYSDSSVVHMKSILNLLPHLNTSVRHSYEMAQILDQFVFPDTAFLVSFDVKSLFTRVPVKDTLKIVQSRLLELEQNNKELLSQTTTLSVRGIMVLLEFLLNDCYFIWSKKLYRQVEGLPMGSRLSPVSAGIYMENLEETALALCPIAPLLYKRYVDDIFIVWDTRYGPYTVLLEIMNNLHPNIILSAEEENKGALAFLDLCVVRPDTTVGRSYSLSVFRKETHADKYIHYSSCHPFTLKRIVLRGLLIRAFRLLRNHPGSLDHELYHLQRTFTSTINGYPLVLIRKWINNFRSEVTRNPKLLDLPNKNRCTTHIDNGSQASVDPAEPTDPDTTPLVSNWVPTLISPYVPGLSE